MGMMLSFIHLRSKHSHFGFKLNQLDGVTMSTGFVLFLLIHF